MLLRPEWRIFFIELSHEENIEYGSSIGSHRVNAVCVPLCMCVCLTRDRNEKVLYFIIFQQNVIRREEVESSEHSQCLIEKALEMEMIAPKGLQ